MSLSETLIGHFAARNHRALAAAAPTTQTYLEKVQAFSTLFWRLNEASGTNFDEGAAGTLNFAGSTGLLYLSETLAQDDSDGRCIELSRAGSTVLTLANNAALNVTAGGFGCLFQVDDLAEKQILISRDGAGGAAGTFSCEVSPGGQLRFWRYDGAGSLNGNDITSAPVIVARQAYSAWFGFGSRGLEIWLDGERVATQSTATNNWATTTTADIKVGRYYNGLAGLDGLLGWIVFRNSQPSAVEIETLATVQNVARANHAPTVVAPGLADQNATNGLPFTFQIPVGRFFDEDGDTLSYAATLSSGAALPGWLTFTPATQTFSGTPTTVGTITVRVTASDGTLSVFDDFTLTTAAVAVSSVPLWPHTDLSQPLTNDDMAIPGGTVRYVKPGGVGIGGSTEGAAGDLQTTLNASSSGQTVVTIPVSGSTAVFDRVTGAFIPSGVTLMAKPATAAVISAGVEFAAFQTPSPGLNTVWTLFDASKNIWRSVATFSPTTSRLCGAWMEVGVAGVHRRPHYIYLYKSLADLQLPVGNYAMPRLVPYSFSPNYAGPGAYLHTDGRVYIRMQKPHPGKYCTGDKWRPYVHVYAYENPSLVSGGRHNYPLSQDPRDYPIFLSRRASQRAFTVGADSTVGSGINSFGYRTTFPTSGWSNVTMRRGLHHGYFGFIEISAASINGGFFDRVRFTVGGMRHLSSGNDFKFNAYLEEFGAGRPEFISHDNGGNSQNFHFRNCTIQGGNDWIVGGVGQQSWQYRFKHCTIFDVLEEGMQAIPCTRLAIENCYFVAAGAWGGSGGGSTPTPLGQMYVHHNIWDCRHLQTEFVGGAAENHGGPLCIPCYHSLNHTQTVPWIWKAWNNTILYGPDTYARQTTAFKQERTNNTAVATEMFNNIIVRMDDTRYAMGGLDNQGIPNDMLQFAMSLGGNVRWDYNMWWRNVPGPITHLKWYGAYADGYNTLAALFAALGFEQHGVEAAPQMGAVTSWTSTPRNYRPTSAGMSATTQPPSGETWDNAVPTWGSEHFSWDTFAITPYNGALDPNGTTMTVGVQNP